MEAVDRKVVMPVHMTVVESFEQVVDLPKIVVGTINHSELKKRARPASELRFNASKAVFRAEEVLNFSQLVRLLILRR